jgi:hypothetical protein
MKKAPPFLFLVIGLCLGVMLLVYQIKHSDMTQLRVVFNNPIPFIGMIICFFMAVILRGKRFL